MNNSKYQMISELFLGTRLIEIRIPCAFCVGMAWTPVRQNRMYDLEQ